MNILYRLCSPRRRALIFYKKNMKFLRGHKGWVWVPKEWGEQKDVEKQLSAIEKYISGIYPNNFMREMLAQNAIGYEMIFMKPEQYNECNEYLRNLLETFVLKKAKTG